MRAAAAAPPDGVGRRRRRWLTAGPAAALGALAAVALLLAATPADAQSNAEFRRQISNLNNQIVGLRAQLTDLERTVHTGATRRSAQADAAPESGLAERTSGRLAELESDIDQVEEWQRRVTGRFEELENMIRRLEGRIERLVADVDFRLATLEQRRGTTPGAAAVAPAGEAPAAAPAGQDQASIAPGQEEGYEPSAAPRALGTVPAEQSGEIAPPPAGTPQEQYQAAFALLESARYEEAYDAFTRFIDAHPTNDLVQNAAYWRSETLYARQMYAEAAQSYARNLRDYPEGRKAPDNLVKLGLALLKLGRSEDACRAFAQLDQAFSDPPLNIRRAAQQGRRQANCP